MSQVMSTGTVAKALGISTSLIRKMEKAGTIPAAQRIDGLDRRIYSEAEVEYLRHLLEQRKVDRQRRRGDSAA